MIIKNGRIFLGSGFLNGDLKIRGRIIEKIDRYISAEEGEYIIDAKGRYLLPGFIDIHTHLDDNIGRYRIADDFDSGSRIAALNGITTVYSFITERADRPLKSAVEEFKIKGGRSVVNYGFHITPVDFSERNSDYIRRLIEKGFISFKFYTTYKDAGIYLGYEEILKAVEMFKTDRTVFLVHCEDEGVLSEFYGLKYACPPDHSLFRPCEAEIKAIANIIEIARTTRARFHIVHCSCGESVRRIYEVRDDLEITSESCPQYLVFSRDWMNDSDGYRLFCTPPLRSEDEREGIVGSASDGLIDIFTTDHCPFFKSDKDENKDDLRKVPNGLPGLGALPHIIYDILVASGGQPISEFSLRLSENPAKIMGIYPQKGVIREGSDADMVVLSESTDRKNIIPTLSSCYNPYEKFGSKLNIDYVIINGVLVVREGEIMRFDHRGRCVNDRE